MARRVPERNPKVEATEYSQLLIDLDCKRWLPRFIQLRLFLRRMKKLINLLADICYIDFMTWIDETKHGYHLRVDILSQDKLSQEHLLFLQALLGDDSIRCIFNFNRMLLGWSWRTNNVFFEENEKHG